MEGGRKVQEGGDTCMHACMLSCFSRVWLLATLWTVPARLLCPWDSSGKNTGVSCHALLQCDLPDPGIGPASLMSLHWQEGSLPLAPTGKFWIYEYLWLSHTVVWQKPTQHGKAIILQLKTLKGLERCWPFNLGECCPLGGREIQLTGRATRLRLQLNSS